MKFPTTILQNPIHVCMYMSACTYVRTCRCLSKMSAIQPTKFTKTHTYIHCRYVCTYVRTCVRTYACTHTCSQAHTCTYVRMYVCTTHVHMYRRTHACIHKHHTPHMSGLVLACVPSEGLQSCLQCGAETGERRRRTELVAMYV